MIVMAAACRQLGFCVGPHRPCRALRKLQAVLPELCQVLMTLV